MSRFLINAIAISKFIIKKEAIILPKTRMDSRLQKVLQLLLAMGIESQRGYNDMFDDLLYILERNNDVYVRYVYSRDCELMPSGYWYVVYSNISKPQFTMDCNVAAKMAAELCMIDHEQLAQIEAAAQANIRPGRRGSAACVC